MSFVSRFIFSCFLVMGLMTSSGEVTATESVAVVKCGMAGFESLKEGAVQIDLKWGEACDKVLKATLFPTNLAGAGKSYEDLSLFTAKHAPTYIYSGLSEAELSDIFSESEALLGEYIFRGLNKNPAARLKHKDADLMWDGQQESITSYMSTIRVTRFFYYYLPYVLRVTSTSGEHIGYFAQGDNFVSENNAAFFMTYGDLTLAVPLTIETEKYRLFESRYNYGAKNEDENQALRNQILMPTPSIEEVVKALSYTPFAIPH